MNVRQKHAFDRRRQRGNTLVLVSASLVVLLGMAGLAIDLVSLYVARSEAQRAADAAALAGAKVFVLPGGCTSAAGGCVPGGPQEAPAKEQAITAGTQNSVAGQSPTILDSDISFNYPTPENPTITVRVSRDATHGGAVPTMFMRVFGVTERAVSTSATAEAYNPSGGPIPVASQCLKPWLLPNCDWNRMVPSSDPKANLNCPDNPTTPTAYASKYVNPDDGSVVNPGPVSSGGVIGELITIKPGDPSSAAAPSKFYPIFLPPGEVASLCPACATGGAGGGASSGSLYRQNIACCNQNQITCGVKTVQPITGNMVGPTRQGVDCLIHEDQGSGAGQDILDPTTLHITAGTNNPFFPPGTSPLTSSDSLVTVPIYDGVTLCPGASCPETINVDVVGFMQIFVREETNPQGTVNVYIVNVAGCGAGGGGGTGGSGGGGAGGGTISSGGASPIPVRLIHN